MAGLGINEFKRQLEEMKKRDKFFADKVKQEEEAKKARKQFFDEAPKLAEDLQAALAYYYRSPLDNFEVYYRVLTSALTVTELAVKEVELECKLAEGNYLRKRLNESKRLIQGWAEETREEIEDRSPEVLKAYKKTFGDSAQIITQGKKKVLVITRKTKHRGYADYYNAYTQKKQESRLDTSYAAELRQLAEFHNKHKTELDQIIFYAFKGTKVFGHFKTPEELAEGASVTTAAAAAPTPEAAAIAT